MSADRRCGAWAGQDTRGVRPTLGSGHADASSGPGGVRRAPARVQEVDLAEPKARRGARPARGVRRLPHRHVHGVGRRPVRLRARRARPRGRRGRRGDRRRASRDVAVGDHVVTLFSPQCRECEHCRQPAHEPLPGDPRASRTSATCPTAPTRLSRDGEPIRHFMGTSTFAEYTVMPEIALAKVPPEAPLRPRLPVRVRAVDRPRRGDVHRQGRAGLDVRRLRRRAWSGSARSPARACRAPSGSSASTCPRTGSSSPAARARRTPGSAATDTVQRVLDETRRLRRRLHVRGDRARRRSCARPSSRRAWAGACARSPAWPARARRSTSSRAT